MENLIQKKQKIVIFQAAHWGGLFPFLQLRFRKHRDDYIIFMYTANPDIELMEKFIKNKIFDKTVRCYWGIGFNGVTEIEVIETINSHYDKILIENNIDINNVDCFYTAYDWENSFGIYLNEKKISFTSVEFTQDSFLDNIKRFTGYYEMGKATKAYSDVFLKLVSIDKENKTALKNMVIYSDSDTKNFLNSLEKVEIIDLNIKFDKDEVKNIIDCFGVDIKLLEDDNHLLLLPNSFGFYEYEINRFFGVSEVEKSRELIYILLSYLIDYYTSETDNIILKSHPNGDLDLKNFSKNMLSIKASMCVEFLLSLNLKINVLSVSTTATKKIKSIINKNISAGYFLIKYFLILNKLYVAFSIFNLISNAQMNHHIYGINREFIINFVKYVFKIKNYNPNGIRCDILKGNIFTIIDKLENSSKKDIFMALVNSDNDTIVVFINSDNTFPFFSLKYDDLLEYIVPVTIYKKQIKDHIICDLQPETIYVFCKNKEIRKKIFEFSLQKMLPYTGIQLNVSPMSKDELEYEQNKIKLKVLPYEITEQNKKMADLEQKISDLENNIQKMVVSKVDDVIDKLDKVGDILKNT